MQVSLSPNPSDTTNTLLMILIHTIDNSAFPDQPSTVPQWNGPAWSVVWSLTLGYASLALGLLAAFGAVMGRQWVSHFSHTGEGTDEVRGRRRQQKLDGLRAWQFDVVISVLPALLHMALALFGMSLSFNLWETNQVLGRMLVCLTALGGLLYIALTALSLWFPSCPYDTPLSTATRWMIKYHVRPAPPQYEELHSIAQVLERSLDHDVFMAAVKRIPDIVAEIPKQSHREEDQDCEVEKQDLYAGEPGDDVGAKASYDCLPLSKHLFDHFVRSVSAMKKQFSASRQDRAIASGKALVSMLSQLNFSSAVDRFWDDARQKFNALPARSVESGSTTYLLHLLIELLPVQDSTQPRNRFELEAAQIPEPLLFWSLPFLRNALRLRPNADPSRFFSIVPPVLQRICFSNKPKRDRSEQLSYFRACQAYLGMLYM